MKPDSASKRLPYSRALLGLAVAAVLASAMSINPLVPGGVKEALAQTPPGNGPSALQATNPFYLALDGGAQGVLATNGRFTLAVRCEAGFDANTTTYVLTSSNDDWFLVQGGGEASGPLPAGERELLFDAGPRGQVAGPLPIVDVAALDDRSYLLLNTVGQGYGVFGHDCIVFGTATIISRIP